jgi:hypothetical protein
LVGLLLFPIVVMDVTPQIASHSVGGALGVAVGGAVGVDVGVLGDAVGVGVPGSEVADAVGVAVGVGVDPAWLVSSVKIVRPKASATTSEARIIERRADCRNFISAFSCGCSQWSTLSNRHSSPVDRTVYSRPQCAVNHFKHQAKRPTPSLQRTPAFSFKKHRPSLQN